LLQLWIERRYVGNDRRAGSLWSSVGSGQGAGRLGESRVRDFTIRSQYVPIHTCGNSRTHESDKIESCGVDDQKVGPPESMAANLTRFVNEIQAIGGNPVLLTPLSRRGFGDDGKVTDALAPWGAGEAAHEGWRACRLLSS
jgi:hypothetical protein